MKILEFFTPNRHFKYQTSQQIEKVEINLKKSFDPTNELLSRLSSAKKVRYYEGQIVEREFVITRGFKNGLHIFPMVQGVIKENKNGCEIIGEIKHPQSVQRVTLFSFILFIITIIVTLIFILMSFDDKQVKMTAMFGTYPLLIFLLCYFISRPRTKSLEKEIIKIIEGKNN